MATDHNFKVKKGLHVLGAEGVYLTDTNTRLHEGSGNALRITTGTGHIDIGSMNSGWVHMQANKNIYILPSSHVSVDGNLQPYTDSSRTLGTSSLRWSHIYGDALTSTGLVTAQRFKGASNAVANTLDIELIDNGNIGATQGMNFIIDTDNNNTGKEFTWRHNSTGTTGGELLATLTESHKFAVGATPALGSSTNNDGAIIINSAWMTSSASLFVNGFSRFAGAIYIHQDTSANKHAAIDYNGSRMVVTGKSGTGATNAFDAPDGFWVNGQEVITSARNLTNIGTISASGNITSSGRGTFESGAGGQGIHLNTTTSWSSGTLYAPGLLWREADGTNIAGIRGFVSSSGVNHLALGTGWLDQEVIISPTNVAFSGSISSGAITSTGNIVTSQVVQGATLKLTNDSTNTSSHRVSVYDSGTTSYGMMLWNTNGTGGDWSTMIYGPNQSNRRISFGKITSSTFDDHGDVTESMFLDLDNDYLYVKQRVAHYGDGDTYLQFDNNRVRLVAGGTTKFDSNNTYQTTAAPSAVSITSSSIVSETVEIVFSQSSTSGVSRYEIWSDGGGSDFSLIGKINGQDAASSMSFVDTTFTDTGTINYRIYAVRYGIYSTAATTSVSFSQPSLDVTNFSAIADLNNFYLQYEKPDSRFLDHIEIYVDTDAASANLARSSATLIYSGDNSSYVHTISASDRNNFHQFWVECVGV